MLSSCHLENGHRRSLVDHTRLYYIMLQDLMSGDLTGLLFLNPNLICFEIVKCVRSGDLWFPCLPLADSIILKVTLLNIQ